MNTLAVRRKAGYSVILGYPGGSIEVTVAGVDGLTGEATLVFMAPESISITRSEVAARTSRGDRKA
jgi:sRNA-binding carbon storage regulator CsrA